MSNKSDPDFWRSIVPGDILTLSDIRTINLSRKQAQGVGGFDYTIKSVTHFEENENLARWYVLELDCIHDKRDVCVIVKVVGQDINLGAMEPLGLECGTREELLKNDMFYLFQEPEDEDCNPSELSYTKEMANGEGFVWFQKPQGELLASITTSIPEESGTEDLLATIVEYGNRSWREDEDSELKEMEDDNEPDEIFILETGTSDKNSFVDFFGIWTLGPADVDILRK